MRIFIPTVIFIVFLIFSCKKPEKFSPVPQITYSSISLKDTVDDPEFGNQIKLVQLSFDFIDGDGDIGFTQSDTTINDSTIEQKKYIYIEVYDYKNGSFKKADLEVPHYYNFPKLKTQNYDQTVKGEVIVSFQYNLPVQYDTVYYSFYIYDLAYNKSNTEVSDTVIIQ